MILYISKLFTYYEKKDFVHIFSRPIFFPNFEAHMFFGVVEIQRGFWENFFSILRISKTKIKEKGAHEREGLHIITSQNSTNC